MDGVKVVGTFKADAMYRTLAAILSARGYGVEVSLKSCEKAEERSSTVRRVCRRAERDSA